MSIFSKSGHLKIVETSGSLMSSYISGVVYFIDTNTYLLSPKQNLSVELSQPLICKVPGDFAKFNELGKLNIFSALIKSSLFYGSEKWRLTEINKRRVETTEIDAPRRSSRISRK
jgi:hypothetical protein